MSSAQPSVEATCLAILALCDAVEMEAPTGASLWPLLDWQNADGSWPTVGESFAVFVDGDPASIRQLDTPAKRQAFIESAPVRPWEARPFPSAHVQ